MTANHWNRELLKKKKILLLLIIYYNKGQNTLDETVDAVVI